MSASLQLFVGTQEGHLHSLVFTPPTEGSSASLEIAHTTEAAGSKPAWLSFHPTERIGASAHRGLDLTS